LGQGVVRPDLRRTRREGRVGRTTARNAVSTAGRIGLLHLEERPRPGRKHLANVVTITSRATHHSQKVSDCSSVKRWRTAERTPIPARNAISGVCQRPKATKSPLW
jgi:hypothetical protein